MTQFTAGNGAAMPNGSGNRPDIKNVLHVVKYTFKDGDTGRTFEVSYGWSTKQRADDCIAEHMEMDGYVSHKYIDPCAPMKPEQE